MKSLLTSFPELNQAFAKPLRDAKAESACAQVLDILLHARAPKSEVRALAHKWSLFSNETNHQSAWEILPRIREFDPEWEPAALAHSRLLLHFNQPKLARQAVAGRTSKEATELHALTFVRENPRVAEGKLSKVNNAALSSFLKLDSAAAELWAAAADAEPKSLAALNGAGRFDLALELASAMEDEDGNATSEVTVRMAQSLLGLGLQAKEGKFAVTSEGLYRNAIGKLERCVSKKPVYSLELARAYEAYGRLLNNWEKREQEGALMEQKSLGAFKRANSASFLPSFAFELRGWELPSEEADN
ncbi:hypothetical protein BASA81_000829 [Batrachochytrium salamandrivorans]|nr:hypothetical protein BASA81_000829 [Batrachochytrium salamandrivorans]